MNVEAFNCFSSLRLNHQILSAKIKLSLRSSAKLRKERIDWNSLKDNNIQIVYNVAVINRYEVLSNPEDDISTDYNNFIEANRVTVKSLLPKKKKKKRKTPAGDQRVAVARKEVQDAFTTYSVTPNAENEMQLQSKKESLTNVYTSLKRKS